MPAAARGHRRVQPVSTQRRAGLVKPLDQLRRCCQHRRQVQVGAVTHGVGDPRISRGHRLGPGVLGRTGQGQLGLRRVNKDIIVFLYKLI